MRRRPILRRWLNVPPVEWEARAAAETTQRLAELEREAAQTAVWVARLSSYLTHRLSGSTHAAAVRAQNRTARGVRKALGFAHADDPFTF